jgi:hypothetical protein
MSLKEKSRLLLSYKGFIWYNKKGNEIKAKVAN